MDHQALAEHIAGNFSLDDVTLKTRVDCERDGDDFIPLDVAKLLDVHQQILDIVDTVEEVFPVGEWALTLIRADGEEVFIPYRKATPEDYANALMVAAAEVRALQEAAQDAVGIFIALAQQARRSAAGAPEEAR